MKRMCLLIAFLSMLFCAEANAKSLVLVLSDSTRVYFLLDDTPVMKLNEGKVTVESKEYAFTDIVRFYISTTDDPSGIETLMAKSGIEMQADRLVIPGKVKAEVYSIAGVKQEVSVTSTDDMTIVSTAQLPRGQYVVKAGKASLKFMKK